MRGSRALAIALALVGMSAPTIATARPRDHSIATVTQSGDDNTAIVRQFGQADAASITQTGDDNAACLAQVGNNLAFDLSQSGGETVAVKQTHGNTHRIPWQACRSMHGGRRFMKANRDADW
jgi:hypothetical protein